MEVHFASIWEKTADLIPNEPALICGNITRTWQEYDDRSSRLANLLRDHGLGDDSKVGLYLHNSNQYLEAQYSAFKINGVPVNVNYRYKEDELIYLLDNSDAEAVYFQGCYSNQIESIKNKLNKVKLYVKVDDGTENLTEAAIDYEEAIATHQQMERIKRSEDCIYML